MAKSAKKTAPKGPRPPLASPKVKTFKLAELREAEYNPRQISDEAMAGLENSISRFGCLELIIVNTRGGRNTIIGGHQRFKALQAQGVKQALCVTVNCSKADERLLNITLNNPHIQGEFIDGLDQYITELEQEAGGEQALLDLRIDQLRAELVNAPPEIKEDEIPEPPKKPKSKTGDLYLLGRHRLLCGDSTVPGDVRRLMGRTRAGLMNTDPPYGVAYNNQDLHPNAGPITDNLINDDLTAEKFQGFLEAAFEIAGQKALAPTAAWYMWHTHLTQGYFAAAAAADVVLHRQIIWVKPALVLGRGQYHFKHEPCFMGWVKGNQPPNYGEGNGERTQTTVWEIDSVSQAERKEFNHPTPKPVALFAIPIVKHLKRGEACYEPFAGSGPQFIAAEQLDRRCYGIEIAPVYCDVIVERWEKYTGHKAQRKRQK